MDCDGCSLDGGGSPGGWVGVRRLGEMGGVRAVSAGGGVLTPHVGFVGRGRREVRRIERTRLRS